MQFETANPPIPMICERCGAIFKTRSLRIGQPPAVEVHSLTLNNHTEPCPFCGGLAAAQDGIYLFMDEAIKVMSPVSVVSLKRLITLLDQARELDLPIEAVQKDAELIEPSFGGLFKPSTWSAPVKAAIITAIAVIAVAVIAAKENPARLDMTDITPSFVIQKIEDQKALETGVTLKRPERPPRPRFKPLPPSPTGPNRAERRRQRALSRRRKPQS